jgi:hypothetical protein
VTLGALQGLNFALKRAEGDWEFSCASEAEVRTSAFPTLVHPLAHKTQLFVFPLLQAKLWYGEFKNATEARQLQDLCNGQLERSKGNEKGICITSTTRA